MMDDDSRENSTAKYRTCKYAKAVGQLAVYVVPGCPRAEMIKGVLVSSKRRCEDCRSWKGKVDSVSGNEYITG